MKSYRYKWYYLHHLTQVSGSITRNNHVFAIGDVHSRSDLLAIVIDAIGVVLLGDIVDRGPSSMEHL